MWNKNCEDIGDFKIFIIVNKTRNESTREQMVLILRFVDKDSYI